MRKAAGFTLLETLAALMIMALCGSLFFSHFSSSLRIVNRTEANERLTMVARSVFSEQRALPLVVGERRGQWSDDVRWLMRVTPVNSDEGNLRLFRLQLTVSLGRLSQTYSTLDVAQIRASR